MPLYSATCPLPKNQMVRRHKAVTPFSPADIAGLALWLKPDAGLNFNGNDEVTEWTDQSNNENNFYQDLDYIALVETNVINGYSSVLFEGGRLNGDDIVTAKTIYAVIKTLGVSAEQYAAIFESTGGSLYSAIVDTEWGSYFSGEYSSGETLQTSTPAIIATLSDDGESYEFRRDGLSIRSDSDGGGFYPRNAAFLGNDSSAGQPASVYVSEIIVYDNVPTLANIELLEDYLLTKYDI